MPLTVSVKVSPVGVALNRLNKRFRDAARASLGRADTVLGEQALLQLTSEGRHGGTPYRKLRPFTVLQRRRKFNYYRRPGSGAPEHPILFWSGGIRATVQGKGSSSVQAKVSAQGNEFTLTRKYRGRGSDTASSRVALSHLGDKSKNRPERPIFPLNQGNRIVRAISTAIARAFGRELKRP